MRKLILRPMPRPMRKLILRPMLRPMLRLILRPMLRLIPRPRPIPIRGSSLRSEPDAEVDCGSVLKAALGADARMSRVP